MELHAFQDMCFKFFLDKVAQRESEQMISVLYRLILLYDYALLFFLP